MNLDKIKKEMLLKKQKAENQAAEGLHETKALRPAQDQFLKNAELEQEIKLVVFTIAGVEYGLEILQVQEVSRLEQDLIVLPGSPDFIAGLVNLREDCIPVLDLHKLFTSSRTKGQILPKLLVVQHNTEKLGIMIEKAKVLTLNKSCIEGVREELICSQEANYIASIAKLKYGQKLILILNLEAVLSFLE